MVQKFQRMPIAQKLLAIVGLLAAALLVVGFAIVISQASRTVSDLSEEGAIAQADALSNELIGELSVVDATAQSLSNSLTTLHQSGVRSRDTAAAILKPGAEASPIALASWFFEAPLAFDGTTVPGHWTSNASGAFVPYWVKQDGQTKMEPNTEAGLYSADYYKLAYDRGKAAITEPYVYETGGKAITMTSVAYPVKSGGRTIGVAGLDIGLDDISARLGKMRPFGVGRVMLLSQSATWVAHPDAKLRMKPYADPGVDEVRKAITSGEVKQVSIPGEDGEIIRFIHPVKLDRLNATWAVVMDVPASALTAPATSLGWQLVVIGLIVLCAVIGALFWAVRSIVGQPLGELSDTVDRLSRGEARAIPFLDREDEVGTLARASDVFRSATEERALADARSAAEQKQVVDTVSSHLEALAGGDLTSPISAEFPASFAALKVNFNNTLANLQELIGSVMESTATIRSGSGEIAQASEDLARRTESNAASLEETSAAISQIDERLKSSAIAAGETVVRADGAIKTVSSGRTLADAAVQAMESVSEGAKGIDSVIEGLDKIAFQTRVLAMNAAVEAGRAGEAGRGFAVVADLVGALAMRSEEEAKRAREQLTATQNDVAGAVDAVQKVDVALTDIASDVAQVHELLGQMATDNIAQSSAISQIASAIDTMDQSTQQNAAMVEETSAAARNLNVESEALAERAGQFRIAAQTSAAAVSLAPVRAPHTPAKAPVVAKAQVNGSALVAAASNDWNDF